MPKAVNEEITESWLTGAVEPELWAPVWLARKTLTGWDEKRTKKTYAELIKVITRWVIDVGRPEKKAQIASGETPSRLKQEINTRAIAALRGIKMGYGIGVSEKPEPWHYGGLIVSNDIDLLVNRLLLGKYHPFLKLTKRDGLEKLLAVLVLGETVKAVTPSEKPIWNDRQYHRHAMTAATACFWLQHFSTGKNKSINLSSREIANLQAGAAANRARLENLNGARKNSSANRRAHKEAWKNIAREKAIQLWPLFPGNNRGEIAKKVKGAYTNNEKLKGSLKNLKNIKLTDEEIGNIVVVNTPPFDKKASGSISNAIKGVKSELKKLGHL